MKNISEHSSDTHEVNLYMIFSKFDEKEFKIEKLNSRHIKKVIPENKKDEFTWILKYSFLVLSFLLFLIGKTIFVYRQNQLISNQFELIKNLSFYSIFVGGVSNFSTQRITSKMSSNLDNFDMNPLFDSILKNFFDFSFSIRFMEKVTDDGGFISTYNQFLTQNSCKDVLSIKNYCKIKLVKSFFLTGIHSQLSYFEITAKNIKAIWTSDQNLASTDTSNNCFFISQLIDFSILLFP